MKVSLKKNDLLVHAPSIWFHKNKTLTRKELSESEDKDNYAKFYVPLDKSDPDSGETTEWSVKKFEKGTAEEYIIWRMRLDELSSAMNLDTVDKKYAVVQTLLRGEAKARFNAAYREEGDGEAPVRAAEKAELAKRKLQAGYAGIAKHLFLPVESAWRRQRTYLRYHLKFGQMTVNEFRNRLLEMNKYLKYFPVPPNKSAVSSLDAEELVEILDRAKPIEYHMDVLTAGYDPYSKSFEEYVEYIERLETKHALSKRLEGGGGDEEDTSSTKKKNKGTKRKRNKDKDKDKSEVTCSKCGKKGHLAKDCWDDPKNADKRPNGYKKFDSNKRRKTGKTDDKSNFSMEQMSFLMKNFQALQKNPKSKTRKVNYDTSETDEEESTHFLNNRSSNSDTDYLRSVNSSYSISAMPKSKRQKQEHLTTAVIVELKNEEGLPVPLRCLLDTGTTSTIVLAKYIHKNLSKYKTKPITWSTLGGKCKTRRKARINFKLPEFSENKSITWSAHVDEFTNPEKAQYDIIIGTDLMEACGIDILFSQQKITWDGDELPMSNRDIVTDKKATEMLFHVVKQSPIIKEAENRHKKILDADYSKVDIDHYVSELDNVEPDAKQRLSTILKNCKNAFKGGLGTLKIKPVSVQLKKGVEPYHAKPFPIPKAYYELMP